MFLRLPLIILLALYSTACQQAEIRNPATTGSAQLAALATKSSKAPEAKKVIFQSLDGGSTWQDISAGLPSDLATTTVYANTVMVGIPLVVQTWGDTGLNIAVAVISLNSLTLFFTYALFAALRGRGMTAGKLGRDLGNTLKNPIIFSLVIGAALNLLHVPIYGPLVESLALPGRAALPCSLLILGATLAGIPLRVQRRDQLQIALICLCKLLLIPYAVYLFAGNVLHLNALTTGVLVLLAACPCGVNVLPFAQKSAADRQLVSAAIFLSTVIAVVTLPLWVYWVG